MSTRVRTGQAQTTVQYLMIVQVWQISKQLLFLWKQVICTTNIFEGSKRLFWTKQTILVNRKAKLIIHESSILPLLTYCHLVWHNCKSSDCRKIEWIQERACRAVLTPLQKHIKNFWFEQSVPSIPNRRRQDMAILMYKVKYGFATSIVDELFKQKNTSYSLRNSDFEYPYF